MEKVICTLVGWVLLSVLTIGQATATESVSHKSPSVVVVLAGGGAKGFAHLAVLRKLEQDGIRISRIVGTSMGAVIGGLYASGLSTDEIEKVVGGLDPAKVALDQLNRLELPTRARAYQRQYPIDLEFGLKDGELGFARGMSDGQRFLALLQQLTANIPASVNFNDLKIPFRAVATRYSDGGLQVFDHGELHMAIRASMAAPAVFAPVEIEDETYVDGGLVANLPIEVALQEGADIIIASYLGQDGDGERKSKLSNALTVANRMLDILIRQNERRNISLLRPHDILIKPSLGDIGFADFNKSSEIIQRGNQALKIVEDKWDQMKSRVLPEMKKEEEIKIRIAFDQREKKITLVKTVGNKDVHPQFVEDVMAPLLQKDFDPNDVAERVDWLYTSGFFEGVTYGLEHLENEKYALIINVREKPYGPHFFKTSLGFFTELGGVTQTTLGLGYRRPWLNESGLELGLDTRIGTQSEFAARLYQPIGLKLGVEAMVSHASNKIPYYVSSDNSDPFLKDKKLTYMGVYSDEMSANIVYEWERKASIKIGVSRNFMSLGPDTLAYSRNANAYLESWKMNFSAVKMQLQLDQLDSWSFPTKGYALSVTAEEAIAGNQYRSLRSSGRLAMSMNSHILNFGFNLGRDIVPNQCQSCGTPSNLYLGGFQLMGAYRMAQLYGDQLVHAQATYMYRLSDGGVLKQGTYLGGVVEAGDAWYKDADVHKMRYSGTLFVAVDSKIGDIYVGVARGSSGASNAFFQLGRRFNF